jgi:hypothetical protein
LRRRDGDAAAVSDDGLAGGGPAGTLIDGGLVMTGSFGGRYGPDGAGGGGGSPSDGAGGGGVQSPGAIQSESSLMVREGYRRRVRDEPRSQEFWNTSRALASWERR